MNRRRNRGGKIKKINRLTDHFSIGDFSCKCGKCRGIFKLSLGLVGGLELLRMKIRRHIKIIKGFVCPEIAQQAKGYKRNYHAQGIAADIWVDRMDIQELFAQCELIPEFNGIGLNLAGKYIHVDTRKVAERSVWVEEADGEIIAMTAENRVQWIKPS